MDSTSLFAEERSIVNHFSAHHFHEDDGKFVVPLLKKPDAQPLARSQAVRRVLYLGCSLFAKSQLTDFDAVMKDMGHAERVPLTDLQKPDQDTFYLPIHTVRKESSSTTKIRMRQPSPPLGCL